MIYELFFIIGLYFIGLLFGLNFKDKVPPSFIMSSGLLWGSVIWSVLILYFMILFSVYNLFYIVISIIVLLFILGLITFKNITISVSDIVCLTAIQAIFLSIFIIVYWFKIINTGFDSIFLLLMAKDISIYNLSEWSLSSPRGFGILFPLLQSPSTAFYKDYFLSLIPMISFTFLITFYILTAYAINQMTTLKFIGVILAILGVLFITSTDYIFFQLFYLHTNLITAVYLYLAVCTFWLGLYQPNHKWYVFGIVSLIGLSLCRTENPLFAIIILSLLLGAKPTTYKERIILVIPFVVITGLWYVKILSFQSTATDVLSNNNILGLIIVIFGFGLLILASRFDVINKYIISNISSLIVFGMIIIAVIMFFFKPLHMYNNLIANSKALLVTGGWEISFFLIISLTIIALGLNRIPYENLFRIIILSGFLVPLILGFFRSPYHAGQGDSANRMFTNMLPIMTLYVLIKFGNYLENNASDKI